MRLNLLIFVTMMWLARAAGAAVLEVDFAAAELPAAGTLVLPASPESVISPAAAALVDQLSPAIAAAGFDGEPGASLTLFGSGGYESVILLGVGAEPLQARDLELLGGSLAGVLLASESRPERVHFMLDGLAADEPRASTSVALGLDAGAYRFGRYKTDEETRSQLETETTVVLHTANPQQALAAWRDDASLVAASVSFARDLISEPANVIYPESFVERTRAAFKGVDGVSIRVLDERDMEKRKMGSLLGVGMGSVRPPRLLVVEYAGGESGAAPVVFAGKGVTFDSGGISIKGGNGMWRMKYDMSGAAAVTGAVLALARRGAPVNAVAVAALVENMPSQKAQRPGDVRTAMSGTTIEVINTDAEGRLILADALWFAQEEYDPAVLIDLATLTGSIRVALGAAYAGLFSRHDALAEQLLRAGEAAGEPVWRMPLHEEFVKAIKSDIADVKNSVEGGYGGASTGAEFIGTFVKPETVWAHLDIAGKAWEFEGRTTTPKGAAGWGVRLLDQWVRDQYETPADAP